MKNLMKLVLILITATVFTACGGSDDPKSVADAYWSALAERDVEKARSYVTKESAQSVSIDEKQDADEILETSFGEQTEENGLVTIPTTLTVTQANGEQQTFSMSTILIQEDGAWKVDAQKTMFSMFGGAMKKMMEGMGEAMKQGMEGMGKAMQESMKEINKAYKDADETKNNNN